MPKTDIKIDVELTRSNDKIRVSFFIILLIAILLLLLPSEFEKLLLSLNLIPRSFSMLGKAAFLLVLRLSIIFLCFTFLFIKRNRLAAETIKIWEKIKSWRARMHHTSNNFKGCFKVNNQPKLSAIYFIMVFLLIYFLYLLSFIYVKFEITSQNYQKRIKGIPEMLARNMLKFFDFNLTLDSVKWNLEIAQNGYDKGPFTLREGQKNWAFFPLYPFMAQALHLMFGLPYLWSFLLINVTSLFLIFYGMLELGRKLMTFYVFRLEEVMIGTFLLSLTPILLHINFINLPLALFILLINSLFEILIFRYQNLHKVLILAICSILLGFSKPQGLIIILLTLIGILIYKYMTGQPNWKLVLLYSIAVLVTWASILLFYKWITGEPLAFIKIQEAWARKNTFPWGNKDIIKAFSRLGITWSYYYEGFFSIIKIAISIGLLLYLFIKLPPLAQSRNGDSLALQVNLLAILVGSISFFMIILPLCTNTLLAFHRLFAFGIPFVFFSLLRVPKRVLIPLILFGLIFQIFAHYLFMSEHRAFKW